MESHNPTALTEAMKASDSEAEPGVLADPAIDADDETDCSWFEGPWAGGNSFCPIIPPKKRLSNWNLMRSLHYDKGG